MEKVRGSDGRLNTLHYTPPLESQVAYKEHKQIIIRGHIQEITSIQYLQNRPWKTIQIILINRLELIIAKSSRNAMWGWGYYGSAQISVMKVHSPTLLAL